MGFVKPLSALTKVFCAASKKKFIQTVNMSPKPIIFNNFITPGKLPMSQFARSTVNPHRQMVENSKVVPNPSKKVITLQMGDPTIFGNFKRPQEAVDAINGNEKLATSRC